MGEAHPRVGEGVGLGRILLGLDDQPARVAGPAQDPEQRPVVDSPVARHREHAVDHRVQEAPVPPARLGERGRPDVLAVDVGDPARVAAGDRQHVAPGVGEVPGVQEKPHRGARRRP